MYLCMYVCMYACMYACVCIIFIFVCICVCVNVCNTAHACMQQFCDFVRILSSEEDNYYRRIITNNNYLGIHLRHSATGCPFQIARPAREKALHRVRFQWLELTLATKETLGKPL